MSTLTWEIPAEITSRPGFIIPPLFSGDGTKLFCDFVDAVWVLDTRSMTLLSKLDICTRKPFLFMRINFTGDRVCCVDETYEEDCGYDDDSNNCVVLDVARNCKVVYEKRNILCATYSAQIDEVVLM